MIIEYKWAYTITKIYFWTGSTFIGQFSYKPIDFSLCMMVTSMNEWQLSMKELKGCLYWWTVSFLSGHRKKDLRNQKKCKDLKMKISLSCFLYKNFSNRSVLIGLLSICINRILLIPAYSVIQIIPNLLMFIWRFV